MINKTYSTKSDFVIRVIFTDDDDNDLNGGDKRNELLVENLTLLRLEHIWETFASFVEFWLMFFYPSYRKIIVLNAIKISKFDYSKFEEAS